MTVISLYVLFLRWQKLHAEKPHIVEGKAVKALTRWVL